MFKSQKGWAVNSGASCTNFVYLNSNVSIPCDNGSPLVYTMIFFLPNVFARYSLAIRLKSLPLYERALLYKSKCAHEHEPPRVYKSATLMPGSATYFHDETVCRLRYFSSRQINFHRDIPAPAFRRRPAGRTIENLARGCTRISRFTAPPTPSATSPCFRCPRGRRHVCLSTSVSTASEIADPRPPFPQLSEAIPHDRVYEYVGHTRKRDQYTYTYAYMCILCTYVHLYLYARR